MKFPEIPRIKKLLIAIIVLNVLVLGSYVFVLDVIKGIAKENALTLQKVKTQSVQKEKLNQQKGVVSRTRKSREKLADYFFKKDNIVSFIEDVEGLATQALVFTEFESVNLVENGQNSILTLTFRSTGEFQNIIHFFSLFESLPYTILFDKVFVEKGGRSFRADGPNGSWNLSVSAHIKGVVD
jgi:Tfp pilus assembly protein PilO